MDRHDLNLRRLATAAVAVLLPILAALPAGSGDGTAGGRATQPSVATFAGGCFWCLEADLEKIEGVFSAVSGYTGGHAKDPTYEEVSAGGTGHAEAVRVEFDPQRVSYEELLEHFWRNIDPTVKDRQFCDVGSQYRSAIFYHDEAQRVAAKRSRKVLATDPSFMGSIYTEIAASTTFYPAEEYHQDYAKHHPIRYRYYRRGCGRDRRLEELWGDKK